MRSGKELKISILKPLELGIENNKFTEILQNRMYQELDKMVNPS